MDVDTVAVDGEWIRHAPHRSALLGRASEATDGRWQHGEVVRALYLADEPATAIAEWYRLLAERGLPPGRAIPHDHHVWELDLQLADLSTPERWPAEGSRRPRRNDEPGQRFRPWARSCSVRASPASSRPAPLAHEDLSAASSTAAPGLPPAAGP
jgi:RES domain-containing protein